MSTADRAGAGPARGPTTDADIDAVIAACGGDARAAIAALLDDLAMLAEEADARISRGYVRGGWPPRCRRRG